MCIRDRALGFLHNKGTDCFNGRIITRNGKITAAESAKIAEAAEKYGDGHVALTTRLTIEVTGIPYENIEPFRECVAEAGLELSLIHICKQPGRLFSGRDLPYLYFTF